MPARNSSMQSEAAGRPRVEPTSEQGSNEIVRVRAEYVEMPGLSLTARQAARLWGFDARRSEHVLSMLVDSGFLRCDRQGRYRRR
ncbi:MAG: hypothetical protein AB7P22_18955 [Vicinamibacterales bacterium]